MMLRTFAVIGLSTLTATATMASVQDGRQSAPSIPTSAASIAAMSDFDLPDTDFARRIIREREQMSQSLPRQAQRFPKTPTHELALPVTDNGKGFAGTGRLMLKFKDSVGARATLYPSTTITSSAGRDLTVVTQILESHNATIRQSIHKSPSELAAVQAKARALSNRHQPDLTAIMQISFPDGISGRRLLSLARQINDLDIVEWLEFETPVLQASGGGIPDVNPTNAATSTPDWISSAWLRDDTPGGNDPVPITTQPIPGTSPQRWEPVAGSVDPRLRYQSDSLQQYQIGTGQLQPPGAFVEDDFKTWFTETNFLGAGGYNFPGMIRLAGQAWRRYGSPPNTTNPAFDVGRTKAGGFLGTLPEPTKVWLYGAEFEIVDITECANGLTDYDCQTCYEVKPCDWDTIIPPPADENPCDGATVPIKDASNPFPEFATDLENLQVYRNIMLCPTGRKTEIAIVDRSAFERHEEFLFDRYGNFLEPEDRPVIFEEGQSMVLLELDEDFRGNASHGTASAGMLVAGNNNFGLTGMTWASRVRFYPSISIEEGARLQSAIVSAIGDLDPGSILCLPVATDNPEASTDPEQGAISGPQAGAFHEALASPACRGGGQFLSTNAAYATLISVARDAGIVVVQAAGNDGALLGSEPGGEDAEGTGAIVATAITPSGFTTFPPAAGGFWGDTTTVDADGNPLPGPWPWCGPTRWAGSNFFGEDVNSNVAARTLSGWGAGVPSLGYGDLYKNLDPAAGFAIPSEELDPLERDFLRSYTGPRGEVLLAPPGDDSYTVGNLIHNAVINTGGSVFQGTSSACVQISGMAAWLQGFGQMFYGTNLSAAQIAAATGSTAPAATLMANYCELVPGDPLDGSAIGFPNGNGNTVNSSSAAAPGGATVSLIPPSPNGPRGVIGLLTQIGQGFDGNVIIHYGDRIRGNKFSLGNAGDGNVLAVRSEPANMGQITEDLTYIVTGETTDVGLIFESPADSEDIISMSLLINRRANIPAVVEVAFARNFEFERYVPLRLEIMPNVLTEAVYDFGEGGTLNIASFVNDDSEVDIRLYTIGMGFIGSTSFVVEYDEIELQVNEDNAPL